MEGMLILQYILQFHYQLTGSANEAYRANKDVAMWAALRKSKV